MVLSVGQGTQQPVACPRAWHAADIFASSIDPIRLMSTARGTNCKLSKFATESWSSPSVVPSLNSDGIDRMVDVIGAAMTE